MRMCVCVCVCVRVYDCVTVSVCVPVCVCLAYTVLNCKLLDTQVQLPLCLGHHMRCSCKPNYPRFPITVLMCALQLRIGADMVEPATRYCMSSMLLWPRPM